MDPIKITAEFTITLEDYERDYRRMTQDWNERHIRNYRGREEDIEVPPVSLKEFHDFVTRVLYWKFGIHTSYRAIKNKTKEFSKGTTISNVKITTMEQGENK